MDSFFLNPSAEQPVQDEHSKLKKLTESYLLLKEKVCRTHDLIKHYNDKLKECERLKADLDTMTKQTNKVTYNYNSTLAKIIKLELKNAEYKKDIETWSTKAADYEIKMAADQQHIKQLICKVKNTEGEQNDKMMQYELEKSSLQVKIGELEQELKNVQKSNASKIKKLEKKIIKENHKTKLGNLPNVQVKQTSDAAVNTTFDTAVFKAETMEKSTMTNEFYEPIDNVYPIFCAKCEGAVESSVEKICKIMSNACPKLIEKISSPLRLSIGLSDEEYKTEDCSRQFDSPSPHAQHQNNPNDFYPVHLPPVRMNQINGYCNDLTVVPNPMANLMDGSNYYVESKVNSISPSNTSEATRNNNCADMALSSSLSIISSLQKKIDTLECNMKKFVKKKPSEESNCWHHEQQTSCCMYNINSSFQSHLTFELCKRIVEMNDGKENKNIPTRKHLAEKFRRLKKRKLRNKYVPPDSWKIESISKKVEASSFKKGSKKFKHRRSLIRNKTDISLCNSKEKFESDCDNNSFTDTNFTTLGRSFSPGNVLSKSKSHILRIKPATIESIMTDENDVIENSGGSTKSMGEADSGILSDSIESSKFLHVEADFNICSDSIQHGKTINFGRTKENAETSNKVVEKLEPENGEESSNESMIKRKIRFNELNSNRHKKVNQPPARNSTSTRKILLRKLKNLKKTSKFTLCHALSDHQDAKDSKDTKLDVEASRILREQTRLNEEEDINSGDFIPKKKPRIAHTPKNTETEEKSFNDYVKGINSPVINMPKILATSVLEIRPEENTTLQEQTKIMHENYSASNGLQSTDLFNEAAHANSETINYLQKETSQNESVTTSSSTKVGTGKININVKSTFDINNSIEEPQGIESPTNTESTNNGNGFDALQDAVGLDQRVKTELNNRCEIHLANETLKNIMTNVKSLQNMNEHSDKLETLNVMLSDNELHENTNSNISNSKSVLSEEVSVVSSNFEKDSFCILQSSHVKNNQTKDTIIFENNIVVHSKDSMNEVPSEQSYAPSCPNNIVEIHALEDDVNMNESFDSTDIKQEKIDINNEDFDKTFKTELEPAVESPLLRLQKYVRTGKPTKTKRNPDLERIRSRTDKFIKKQLYRLVEGDWEVSLHWDVLQTIKNIYSARIIAKNIVDFLNTEQRYQENLDTSFTPPAPIMTKSQQKITALIVDLEEFIPDTCHFVQAGIEYNLFQTSQKKKIPCIDSLARTYTVLARIRKDREKVRIFCCDALYWIGNHATTVLYAVLTCWPEIFPNAETNKELLPKCIAHIIMSTQLQSYPKLNALKNLVSVFYRYPGDLVRDNFARDLISALQNKSCAGVNTAILLLAKKEGTSWTHKTIIRSALLPMIINNRHPDTYRAFSLLGTLLRPFSINDKDNSVGEIVNQLCDVLKSGEGSHEQQEGIISALISLTRHKFDQVADAVFKWNPTKSLNSRTVQQIDAFIGSRKAYIWNEYLKNADPSSKRFVKAKKKKVRHIDAPEET